MSIELLTILLFATFIILLLTGLPIAWVMGATAVLFGLILFDPAIMNMMVTRIYTLMFSYALLAVPLFIFMGNILQRSGVTEQLFNTVYIWFGRIRGGLAITTIIACTITAALVGVVGAEVVTFGIIALPAMLARKYDKNIALGCISAGGGLATLIPPSVVFILYGMVCSVSIGELYIAGIIPGLILAAAFIAYIAIRSWLNPNLAPAAPPEERNLALKEKLLLLRGLIMPAVLIFIVLGSIYIGIATPTEAGALGCVGSLICAAYNRKLTLEDIKNSLFTTALVSSMIVWLLFGSQTIIGIYTLAGGTQFVKNALIGLPFGKWGVIIIMQLILILLGCLIDWIGILMLTMPLFLPILQDLGFDLVWFGVVFCMNMQIGYISPPFGPACFYLKSVAPPDVTLDDIFKSIWPFFVLDILVLTLTVVFPELSLWLPSKMMTK
jgi:tripartite ATP-independent transporter DctM subunit